MGQVLQRKLGSVIRNHRERLGFTQEDFAYEIGIDRSYYGRIERGEANISLDRLALIAEAVGVTASKLLAEAEQA